VGQFVMSQVAIVIPARYASSRFPGKPLHSIAGVSMLRRVWNIAKATRAGARVVIATDDRRIVDHARSFGAEAVMTSDNCRNGTERVFETLEGAQIASDLVINLQGDALLTPPWVLDAMIQEMLDDSAVEMVTPAVALDEAALSAFVAHKAATPASGTSVVFDTKRDALYFSKVVIPFMRQRGLTSVYRHIGLYGYRRECLAKYIALKQGPLELTEGLEQLRALEHGMKLRVTIVDYRGRTHGSVDAPEDVRVIEDIIAREGELLDVPR
jgi:3-deoxy-manno-octulosonate cytidylyltransferase (CMP-KDO synthetase)